jgi:hypothetical protein
MKWPFRRKQNIEGVPQEIQDYYQSERRERTGIAWLLALGTLLTTIALAILLFFGGRWVYRKVANRDNNGNTSQVTQQPTEETTAPPNEAGQQPSGGQDGAGGGTSSTATNTPSSNPATTPSGQGQPQTRGTSSDLPDTGPGDVLTIFAVTTAIGTAAHYAVTTRKTEA